MIEIPPQFAQTACDILGDGGPGWLAQLPALVDEVADRWGLTLGSPFSLSYNYVIAVTRRDGTPAVLKIGLPGDEARREIDALIHYDGRGICRLLEVDHEKGQAIMLLERLRPGTMLVELADDDQATAIACEVMRNLWRPVPAAHQFVPLERWTAGLKRVYTKFNGGTGPLPAGMVAKAIALFDELIGSAGEPVLLHGDLHHYNILAATREPWLAIDPKGVYGDPAYDVGPFLYNPFPDDPRWADPRSLLARRVDQLADELALDRERIIGYGYAQAVLSAWWSVEDHGHRGESVLRCAELLAEL